MSDPMAYDKLYLDGLEDGAKKAEAEIADLKRSLSEVLIALDGREPEGGIYTSQAAQRVADLKRRVEALAEYAQHKDGCQHLETLPIGTAIPARVIRACDCGKEAALTAWQEFKKGEAGNA